MRIPSDYAVLRDIHERYYETFVNFSKAGVERSAKIMVPIDVTVVAKRFKVDPDIIFGRLYYHLEQKWGYETGAKTRVAFFALAAGSDRHCVNFPLLQAVLAGMFEEKRKDRWVIGLAIASIIISIVTAAITFLHG